MSKPIIQVAAGIIRNEFGQLYLPLRLEGQENWKKRFAFTF